MNLHRKTDIMTLTCIYTSQTKITGQWKLEIKIEVFEIRLDFF